LNSYAELFSGALGMGYCSYCPSAGTMLISLSMLGFSNTGFVSDDIGSP